MYKTIDEYSIKLANAAENVVIENDRKFFYPYIAEVELFAAENGWLINQSIGLTIVLEIYGENIFEGAKTLSLRLTKVTSSDYVNSRHISVSTVLKNRELHIFVGTRLLVRIFYLGKFKGTSYGDIIKPLVSKGLLSGSSIKQYYDQLTTIYNLRILCNYQMISKFESAIGYIKTRSNNVFRLLVQPDDDKLYKNIYIKMSMDPCNIICGQSAINIYINYNSSTAKSSYIDSTVFFPQFITTLSPVEFREKLTIIGYKKVDFNTYEISLHQDMQLKRTVYYASNGAHICETYNILQYEVVPYVTFPDLKIRFASPALAIRLLMVTSWINIITKNPHAKEKDILKTMISTFFGQNMKYNPLPSDDFAGQYVSDVNYKKKISLAESKVPIQNYIPAASQSLL